MFVPRSVFALRNWVGFGKPGPAKRQERLTGLQLEILEDRTLLSTWASKGPGPILNGAPGGDPSSGRIAALAADPTDPNTIYIAAAGGGVWKTTDAGTTWMPLTDAQQTLFMGAIALAPSNPTTIYAGTGEADNSGDSFYGRGVLKSTDAGASWTLLGNAQFDRKAISQIMVSPTDPNTVYVAVGGLSGTAGNIGSGGTGIWKSTDGGTTWVNTTTRISTTAAFSDLAMDPLDAQTLYAGVGFLYGSTANGVYKTVNGGASWSLLSGGLPNGTSVGTTKIAIAPSDPQTVYVSIAGSGVGSAFGSLFQMMKTVDGGASWTSLTTTPNYMLSQGWYDSTLAVDPLSADTVYAGGGSVNIIRSLDGGATWSNIGAGSHTPHEDHHGVGFDAAGRLLDGNDGGVWRLDNQDPIRWANLNGNLQITQFYSVALHPTNAAIIYGGSQDNGTDKTTGSAAWTEVFGGDGAEVQIDFNSPQTVYQETQQLGAGTAGSGFLRRSDNAGTFWTPKTSGIAPSDPSNFYIPYVMDPSNSSRLLLGTNRVYETTNRADDWSPISTPNANGWVGSDAIDSLAAAPNDPDTIYVSAGGDLGFGTRWRIFVTTNHGASWSQRNLPVGGRINELQVDPANSQIAYAVRNVFNGGHVFRTTNGGQSWVDISGNLPNLPTYAIALGAGILYVGTDDGVYFSNNVGASWSHLGDGLPHAQVRELVLNTTLGILAAATHGRGVWELSVGSVATHFSVTPSANPVTAGSPFQITVTALDDQNNPISGYTGTVHFASTDNGATLPGDYTFTGADAGVHTFAVTLIQAGSQKITVTDPGAGLSGSLTLTVNPATADHYSISARAGSTAGTAFDVTVTALDPFNNTDFNYQGTVHFTTTDAGPGVVLPSDTTFTAADGGIHTFGGGVTLVTAGSQTVAATDTVSGITGRVVVAVTAASPDHLLIIAPNTVVSGMAFDVTVTVQDAFNNTVTTYLGTVQFMSTDNDPAVILPPDYSFTSNDAGMHTFVGGVTLITVGSQTITVSDPSAGISGAAVVNVISAGPPPGGGGNALPPDWIGLPPSVVRPIDGIWESARAEEAEAFFRLDGAQAAWTALPWLPVSPG